MLGCSVVVCTEGPAKAGSRVAQSRVSLFPKLRSSLVSILCAFPSLHAPFALPGKLFRPLCEMNELLLKLKDANQTLETPLLLPPPNHFDSSLWRIHIASNGELCYGTWALHLHVSVHTCSRP